MNTGFSLGAVLSIALTCFACAGQQAAPAAAGGAGSAPAAPLCVEASAAEGVTEHAWREFRAVYPSHIQTVAVSEPFGAGCRIVIVSEPPPAVSLATVQGALPAGSGRLSARRWTIGFDGWAKDFTAIVPAETELAGMTKGIHRALFGTDYKAYLTLISAVPPSPTGLRVTVSPADLSDWLRAPDAELISVDADRKTISASRALSGEVRGVFHSSIPGLVVWALPRPTSLDGKATEAREFALESDLVLGALTNKKTLVIVGRERATSVDRIAPLRYETLVMLASVPGMELGQSYERMNVLAGRFDGKNDWAPIYLSPELVDTEFGSTLNIADQLLKGWSNSGVTSYANFNHAPPLSWPFPQPLPAYLQAETLTYNWNTHGAGAVVETDDDVSIYWVRDTGALPVTYLPEGIDSPSAVAAAQDAQSFFARQDDPTLVRVVQYTALYQIFRAFGVTASDPRALAKTEPAGKVLEEAAFQSLRKLSALEDGEVRAAVEREFTREGIPFLKNGQPSLEAVGTIFQALMLSSKLEELEPSDRDEAERLIAHGMANPGHDLAQILAKLSAGGTLSEAEQNKVVGMMLARGMSEYSTAVKAFVPDLRGVRDSYAAAYLGDRDPVIRTPSIVVSTNAGVMQEATGGHNLRATVAHVAVKSGRAASFTTDAGVNHSLNSAKSLREIGIGSNGEIQRITARPKSSADWVLRIPAVSKAAPRGFALAPPGAEGLLQEKRSTPGFPTLSVQKTPTGFIARGVGAKFEAASRVELVEKLNPLLMAHRDAVTIQADGLTPDEVRGLVRSCELKTRNEVFGVAGQRSLAADRINLTSATVEPPTIRTLDNGVVEASFRVGVPSATPGKLSWGARIRFFFSKLAGARVREYVGAAIVRVRAHFGGQPASLEEIASELRRDLRRVDASVGITIERGEGDNPAADFFVGALERTLGTTNS